MANINAIQRPPPRDSVIFEQNGAPSQLWGGWFRHLAQQINANYNAGFSGTIATAKLTGGGSNGSMTFVNGILIGQVPAT